MRSIRTILAASALLAVATACSQEAEAPANETTAVDTNTMMDLRNPYAQAEMQMMERMQAAHGANPSETWTRKMIEHHRGAIAMADILVAQGGDPQVVEKARMTADMQRKEIAELEALLPAGGAQASATGGENPFAQAASQMHQQMMAASGANPSETWLRKMIVHHRGGAEMSNVLLDLGGDPKVLEKARMTAQKQMQEASELERMLQGGSAPAGAGSSAASPPPSEPTAPQPKAQPARAKAEAPKAPAKAAEEPADPHAGHDIGNMSNMSH